MVRAEKKNTHTHKKTRVCVFEGLGRDTYHMYSAITFSVVSERLRLMRSESRDIFKIKGLKWKLFTPTTSLSPPLSLLNPQIQYGNARTEAKLLWDFIVTSRTWNHNNNFLKTEKKSFLFEFKCFQQKKKKKRRL